MNLAIPMIFAMTMGGNISCFFFGGGGVTMGSWLPQTLVAIFCWGGVTMRVVA